MREGITRGDTAPRAQRPRDHALGFGAWGVGGGGWNGGYGPQDDRDSIAAIHRALELGVNWIDTAAIYGVGHSEEVVGRALAGLAERPYVFTKCSLVRDAAGEVVTDLRAASIRQECEDSLRRLGVGRDRPVPGALAGARHRRVAGRGLVDAGRPQREGKVRHLGGSNFELEHIRRVEPIAPIVSMQPPYSLLQREAEQELLPAPAGGIGVIVYSPMARAAQRLDDAERAGPCPRTTGAAQTRASRSRSCRPAWPWPSGCARWRGASGPPGEVAIAWTLANPTVTGAIVGFRLPAQVDELARRRGARARRERDLADLDALTRREN